MIPRGTSFARAVEPGAGHQSQDRREVAEAGDDRRAEDWTKEAALYGSDRGGGGDDRRVPASHTAAAGVQASGKRSGESSVAKNASMRCNRRSRT